MFGAIISDVCAILLGITLFLLLLWVFIIAINLFILAINCFADWKPLSYLSTLLEHYKAIPVAFFSLFITIAFLGFLLNTIMGDSLDALCEKFFAVDTTVAAEHAASAGISPLPSNFRGKLFTNSLGMEFILIPAGTYPVWDEGRREEKKIVEKNEFGEIKVEYTPRMVISKAFYLSKFPVTQEQWVTIMGKNPAKGTLGRTKPVTGVSWFDAQEFIESLNRQEKVAGYRMPTEVEWEYAYRKVRSDDARQSPAMKKDTALHMQDLHIYEWVYDRYGRLPTQRETVDYHGPEKGSERVLRRYGARRGEEPGGGFLDISSDYDEIGFRLAFTAKTVQ